MLWIVLGVLMLLVAATAIGLRGKVTVRRVRPDAPAAPLFTAKLFDMDTPEGRREAARFGIPNE